MNSVEHAPAPGLASENSMDQLLSQLRHYQRQSERLQKVNTLYQRLAGVLDLPTIIETYSIWLAGHVAHELIGYHNQTRQRMHLFCSSHGPERRYIIDVAEKILKNPNNPTFRAGDTNDLHSYQWNFESNEGSALLLLLRKNVPVPADDIELINESLSILSEPLKRTLDYEEIFEQARKDTLTGLPNRLVFEERVDGIIEQSNRYNHPLTLAALDLDHFKDVNDTMGHLMGDEVLQQVAKALKAQIRTSDLLVRMGGDEFLLILPDTDMTAARNLGERLCRAVEFLDITAGQAKLGISIGLAQWQPGMSKSQWLEQADDILYQAKKNGRSQVAVH
jgi:diguanylate cyclase (GGDEF)-like protein